MTRTVFLNSAKLDFDRALDLSPLRATTALTTWDASDPREIVERVQGQEVVITKELPLGKELLERFPPTVKLVCEAGTGFNNIDVRAARARGIAVCNVPTYATEAVAQLAITFVLSLSSSLVEQQHLLHRRRFENFTKHLQVRHFELAGKTLGVVGAGAIGRHVAKLARALGMDVLAHDLAPRPLDAPGVRFVSLPELLRSSDFVSLHCPLTPETKHLVNRDTLAFMKPTAFLVNTSRGGLVKEVDLVAALERGALAGAALDVQEQEPPDLDNPLLRMDNVIVTPHIGWKRLESRQRLVQLTAENIAAFGRGAPVNVVN